MVDLGSLSFLFFLKERIFFYERLLMGVGGVVSLLKKIQTFQGLMRSYTLKKLTCYLAL